MNEESNSVWMPVVRQIDIFNYVRMFQFGLVLVLNLANWDIIILLFYPDDELKYHF